MRSHRVVHSINCCATSAIAASTTGRVYRSDPTHSRLAVYLHPDRDTKVSRTLTVPEGPTHGALALDQPRHLAIAATGNHVTALDDRTARTVRAGTVGGVIDDIVVDPAIDTLDISATDGLTIVDRGPGTVITRISAYGPAGPVTVDTTRHIAFVATGSGSSQSPATQPAPNESTPRGFRSTNSHDRSGTGEATRLNRYGIRTFTQSTGVSAARTARGLSESQVRHPYRSGGHVSKATQSNPTTTIG